MSRRTWLAAFVLAGAAFLFRPAGPAVSAQPISAQDLTTTLDDQTELAVTVYNSDIALVRDVRSLQLARGTTVTRRDGGCPARRTGRAPAAGAVLAVSRCDA